MTETIDTAAREAQLDAAEAFLQEHLGSLGWTVRRSTSGVKARWRWLSVGVKFREGRENPWRARMRDGMPRVTVVQERGLDAVEALRPVVDYAREVETLCVGTGLFANPSKGYLGHRLWQAVRPVNG